MMTSHKHEKTFEKRRVYEKKLSKLVENMHEM